MEADCRCSCIRKSASLRQITVREDIPENNYFRGETDNRFKDLQMAIQTTRYSKDPL